MYVDASLITRSLPAGVYLFGGCRLSGSLGDGEVLCSKNAEEIWSRELCLRRQSSTVSIRELIVWSALVVVSNM